MSLFSKVTTYQPTHLSDFGVALWWKCLHVLAIISNCLFCSVVSFPQTGKTPRRKNQSNNDCMAVFIQYCSRDPILSCQCLTVLHIYETETVDAGKKADSFGCCQTECMPSSSLVINHIYEISTSVPVVTASGMVNPRFKKGFASFHSVLKYTLLNSLIL